MIQELVHPQRALFIAAHPDDIEFAAAGTAAKWIQAGTRVRYVLVTSGDVGSFTPGITHEEVARIREAEQRAAAGVIDMDESDVVFLGYRDGQVEPTLTLRCDLVREIRRFKPGTVVCFDPTRLYAGRGYINHPDHRAVGQAALDAACAAGFPLGFTELRQQGFEPHAVQEILITFAARSDTWIDITDTLDLKLEALRQHVSQFPADQIPAALLCEWASECGKPAGFRYAEAFRRIVLSVGLTVEGLIEAG